MMLAALLLLGAGQAVPASYSNADPVPTEAMRALNTDRPDETESPYTVDVGHVQVEMDFATYTRDRDGAVRTQTITVAPFNLKLGIGRDTDLQVVVETHVHQRTDDRAAGTRRDIDGFGDVTVRLKHNLWGNDGGDTAFGLMPFVTLPTSGNGLGNGRVEGGLIAPLAVSLPGGLDLGVMTEVDILRKDDDRGYAPTFVNSATLSGDLTDRLGLYGEVFTEIGSDRGAQLVATLDTGLTLAIGKNTQFDVGVNIGVTDAADDLNMFAGVSRRF